MPTLLSSPVHLLFTSLSLATCQLLAGLDPSELARLGLAGTSGDASGGQSFAYLRADSPGVIEGESDGAHFNRTCSALGLVGVGEPQRKDMWALLASVLLLGQVAFVEDPDPTAAEADGGAKAATLPLDDKAASVAALLGVGAEALARAMTKRSIVARGEELIVRLSVAAAANCRDALAKHLYTGLFDWLVRRINAAIGAASGVGDGRWIGILDIFGFERFQVNGERCVPRAPQPNPFALRPVKILQGRMTHAWGILTPLFGSGLLHR